MPPQIPIAAPTKWPNRLPMDRLPFAIRGRRTRTKDEDEDEDEDDLKDPIAALSSSSSRTPSSVDDDDPHIDLCTGTHGPRFRVLIHVQHWKT